MLAAAAAAAPAVSNHFEITVNSFELLTVPHCNTMLGRRRISVAAPRVWNSLPLGLKN